MGADLTVTAVTSEAVAAAESARAAYRHRCGMPATSSGSERGEIAAMLQAALPHLVPEPAGYVVLARHRNGAGPYLDTMGMWKTRPEAEADRADARGRTMYLGERFTIAAVVELPENERS